MKNRFTDISRWFYTICFMITFSKANSPQLPTVEQIVVKRGRGRQKNQIMSNALANEYETKKKKSAKGKRSKSQKTWSLFTFLNDDEFFLVC